MDLISATPPKRESNKGPSDEELVEVQTALSNLEAVQIKGQTYRTDAGARAGALRLRAQLTDKGLVDPAQIRTRVWETETEGEYVWALSAKE